MTDTAVMSAPQDLAASSKNFDWLMIVLSAWLAGGVFVDGWAHNHLESTLETFFTPWHALLYSGFGACALALAITAWRNNKKGSPWRNSLPPGYMPSLLGAAIFSVGGVADMAWHLIFGIEKDIEALLSPTHLVLVVGVVLVVSGPFRAAWRRPGVPGSFIAALPMILSMTFALSLLSFITQFAHPVRAGVDGIMPATRDLADLRQGRGVAGFLLQMALLMGFPLLVVRRWAANLPFGMFAAYFTLNMCGMALMTNEYRLIFAAFAAGLLADLLVRVLAPSAENVRGLRLFAFAVPAAWMLAYFLDLMLTGHIWWSVHMWTGTIAMAGAAGLLLSYLLVPPRIPANA